MIKYHSYSKSLISLDEKIKETAHHGFVNLRK